MQQNTSDMTSIVYTLLPSLGIYVSIVPHSLQLLTDLHAAEQITFGIRKVIPWGTLLKRRIYRKCKGPCISETHKPIKHFYRLGQSGIVYFVPHFTCIM